MFIIHKDRRILERGLHIHILNRLESPRRAYRGVLSKIKAMIDWMTEELKLKDKKAQEECAEEICKGQTVLIDPKSLVDALHNDVGAPALHKALGVAWQGDTLGVHHKMLAAIACKQYIIVKKLLPDCAADVSFPSHQRLLCNTLALALGRTDFSTGSPYTLRTKFPKTSSC